MPFVSTKEEIKSQIQESLDFCEFKDTNQIELDEFFKLALAEKLQTKTKRKREITASAANARRVRYQLQPLFLVFVLFTS